MKFDTKKLVTLSLLAALSVILVYFLHFPIFPSASYLEYDPADIPILIGTFVYGPWAGLLLTVAAATIQGLTVSAQSGWIGILMHIFATGSFVLVAGNIYKHRKTMVTAILALLAGIFTMTVVMVIWNIILTPVFTGFPREAILQIILPVIVPFNLIKAGANSLVTFLVYKTVEKALRLR